MDLNTALAASQTSKGPQCSVCALVDNPPAGTTTAELATVLASDAQQAHLARAFALLTGDPAWNGRGQTIGRHRRQHS